MQKHPGVVGKVQGQLNSLRAANAEVKKSIQGMNLSDADRVKILGAVTLAYRRQQMALASEVSPATDLAVKGLEVLTEQELAAANAAQKNTDQSKRMANQLGRAGFRMMILGRMILRAGIGPLNKMAATMRGWEKSVENTIIALGMQEAGLGDTGMSAEDLRKQIGGLVTEGPKVETAMRGIGATMSQIAIDNAPALISILESLQAILEGAGGAFISGLVDGIDNAMAFVEQISTALDGPLGDALGKITSALVVLAPLFIAIGAVLLAVATVAMVSLAPSISAVAILVGILIAASVLLIAFMKDIAKWMGNVTLALLQGFGQIGDIIGGVFKGIGRFLGMVVDGWKLIFEGFFQWLINIAEKFRPLFQFFGNVIDKLTGKGGNNTITINTPGGTGAQEVNISNTYEIGEISSDMDLEKIVDASNRGTDSALTDRSWNDGSIP